MFHRRSWIWIPIFVLALCAISAHREARASDWAIGLKRFALVDSVGGGATTGIVTYPTAARVTSLEVGGFKLAAAEEAPPAAGSFPLIVLSHGAGGLPEMYLWLFAGLTAKGFVVAGLAHPNDNYNDRSGTFGDAELVYRARHISALIDQLQHDARLGQSLDLGRIGMVGHSAGGYTGLLLAGGLPDYSQLRGSRCKRRAEQSADRPSYVHDPAATPTADARVRAVAAMAPGFGCLFDRDGVSSIRVPIRLYQADNDEVLQPGFNASYFDGLFAQPPGVVHVENAGHFVFVNTCSLIMSLFARDICFDPWGTNRDQVHRRLIEDIAQFYAQALDAKLP